MTITDLVAPEAIVPALKVSSKKRRCRISLRVRPH
jgi:hypothetical protein